MDDSTSIKRPEQRNDVRKKLAASMRQIRGYQKLCREVFFLNNYFLSKVRSKNGALKGMIWRMRNMRKN